LEAPRGPPPEPPGRWIRVGSDEAMETRAHIPTRRPRSALACVALLVSVLACAALSAAAFGRTAHDSRRTGCTSARHARHGAAKHCGKHHGQKSHKAKKPAAKAPAPAPKLTPAVCEDGSAPARTASGSFSCEDGSAPACEDGSEPVRPSSSSAPMCRVPKEEPQPACEANGECSVE